MQRGRAIAIIGVTIATLVACNALTGVGDLDTAECSTDCDAGVPERATLPDASGPVDDGSVKVDAPAPADGGNDAANRPTFCSGITLYLPLDGTLEARSGQPADLPPAVTYVPGKFGQGLDLSTAANNNAAVYYAVTYGGKTAYALAGGTLAMWVKPVWQPPCNQVVSVFFKPRAMHATSATNAGPVLECKDILGLTVDAPDGGLTAAGYASAAIPNWSTGGWNHLVGTWSSTSPTLQFSLNGAAPLSTGLPWVPNEAPVNFLRIGSEASTPRSVFDEVVFWTRVLAASEIAALAASPISVGDACGL